MTDFADMRECVERYLEMAEPYKCNKPLTKLAVSRLPLVSKKLQAIIIFVLYRTVLKHKFSFYDTFITSDTDEILSKQDRMHLWEKRAEAEGILFHRGCLKMRDALIAIEDDSK